MISVYQLCLLVLGSVWGNTQVTASNVPATCSPTQYLQETLNKCCARCPPGLHVKTECTASLDTECQPCQSGTYTEGWNFAAKCRTCKPCPDYLVLKEPCSSNHSTVCGCSAGFTCVQDGLGKCLSCQKIPPTPLPSENNPTTEVSFKPITGRNVIIAPDSARLWIQVAVPALLVSIVLVVIFFCYKKCILRNVGNIFKSKASCESKPQYESSGSSSLVTVKVASPAKPLLQQGVQYHRPIPEEGNALNFPIQETDASQSGVCTLNST